MSSLFPLYVVWIEGILLFHNQGLKISQPDANADVETIPGGVVGVSPGPDKCTIEADNVEPKAGADFDFDKAKAERTELHFKVQQIGSPKSLEGTFIIRSCDRDGQVGGTPKISFMASSLGSPAPRFK